ncbi:MAG: hypothetical protein ACK5OX_17355 [Desertimonas sp.]
MTRLGADVEQLDRLAVSLDTQARQLTSSLDGTSAAMVNTWWVGPDAERTRRWWRGTASTDVRALAERLGQLAISVRRQAAEQRRASHDAGGALGGLDGGGAPRWSPVGPSSWPTNPLGPQPFIPPIWATAGFLEGVADIFDGEEDDDEGQSPGFGIPGPVDDWIREGGEAFVDRGTTWLDYSLRTVQRRVEHPIQTLVDAYTGTVMLEDLTAAIQIGINDAEIVETSYGNDAVFLTNAWTPSGADAITLGHTVSVASEAPPSQTLVDHEMQHVYDIEDVGGVPFYGSYGVDYVWNRVVEGQSHDEAYRNIVWEQRAYGLESSGEEPQGLYDGIWKRMWTIG